MQPQALARERVLPIPALLILVLVRKSPPMAAAAVLERQVPVMEPLAQAPARAVQALMPARVMQPRVPEQELAAQRNNSPA